MARWFGDLQWAAVMVLGLLLVYGQTVTRRARLP